MTQSETCHVFPGVRQSAAGDRSAGPRAAFSGHRQRHLFRRRRFALSLLPTVGGGGRLLGPEVSSLLPLLRTHLSAVSPYLMVSPGNLSFFSKSAKKKLELASLLLRFRVSPWSFSADTCISGCWRFAMRTRASNTRGNAVSLCRPPN